MIYITGDTHGRTCLFDNPLISSMCKEDFIIITGDFGFVFDDSLLEEEEESLSEIESRVHGTVLFIDGNHENFKRLNAYPRKKRWDGRVHVIRQNIYHLMRGQVYSIPVDSRRNCKVFTMGGGYTIDQSLRQENLWWPDELPTRSEYVEALLNLKQHLDSVDFIISHTCPTKTIYRMGKQPCHEEKTLNDFLQYISETVTYKHWYFGHWHKDFRNIYRNQSCIYKDIYNMATNETVYKHQS